MRKYGINYKKISCQILMTFNKNLLVIVKNNQVISRQNSSTPGVYKFFNVEANTKYKIELIGYLSKVRTTLWIVDDTVTNNIIRDKDQLHYDSKHVGRIKIGVLFKSAKYGSSFYLKDIDIVKINDNIEDKNMVKEYYEGKNEVEKLDISIIIPCHYKHFKYLDSLLQFYNQQTMMQKEIIVVLSECDMINEEDITDLKNKEYSYQLKIINIKEKSPAGNNRYIGSKDACGDIIIFQDADDLPHIQRNEIIHRSFINNPSICHILHGYSIYNIVNKHYNVNKIPTRIFSHNMFNNHREMASYSLTNGNIAIRKFIVDRVKWETRRYRGQDVIFNKNLYMALKRYLIIRLPLYVYRERLSTKRYVLRNRAVRSNI